MSIQSAEIICVGTELLMGHTLNTNSCFLAKELVSLGIASYRQIVVGDNHERLADQIKESASRADLVILTGGLGPMTDDITMGVAAEVAGKELVFDEEVIKFLAHASLVLNIQFIKTNRRNTGLERLNIVLGGIALGNDIAQLQATSACACALAELDM